MSAARGIEDEPRAVVVDRTPPGRGWFRRRRNRRVPFARPSLAVEMAGGLRWLGRKLVVTAKVLAVAGAVALSLLAGRQLVRHVIASPRFAVREVLVDFPRNPQPGSEPPALGSDERSASSPTRKSAHVADDEIRALAGVHPGDRLLAVDPDAVASRLTTHPWIASARVRRELPSTLSIEVTERRAVGAALMGALYLVDEAGHPFKRATFEEADGLPVITGVTREQYAWVRPTGEAVFREALAVLAAYAKDADGAVVARPKLSEIHVDPRLGFTLVLLDGGGEVRLGRGNTIAKLERFDRIVAALGPRGSAALTTVFLDGPLADRVTVKLSGKPDSVESPPAPVTVASKKFRVPDKRGED